MTDIPAEFISDNQLPKNPYEITLANATLTALALALNSAYTSIEYLPLNDTQYTIGTVYYERLRRLEWVDESELQADLRSVLEWRTVRYIPVRLAHVIYAVLRHMDFENEFKRPILEILYPEHTP